LRTVLAAVREGDKLLAPTMDRFARNAEETLRVMRQLTDRGVTFQFNRSVYDPTDPFMKLFLIFLAALAEAEGGWINLRSEEAMARPSMLAKLKGRHPASPLSKTPRSHATWIKACSRRASSR